MPELNSSAVNSFIEAVKNGAAEAASSFARTFDLNITIEPQDGGAFQVDKFVETLRGQKGLALLLTVGSQGIAVLIPSSSGLVPSWCDAPDATGRSKLSTFAQEWGMNLVPEDFFPEDFKAGVVRDLSANLLRAMPELDAGFLALNIKKPDNTGAAVYLVWALSAAEELLKEPNLETADVLPPPPFVAPDFGGGADPFADHSLGQPNFGAIPHRKRIEDLPGYSRSMMKVKIPVAAVLARARKPIKLVLELGVGSVIQFDKSCDELLEVEVGQTVTIAAGEAVKVGEKFGVRINTLSLPEERFRRVEVRREGEYRAKTDITQIIGKSPIRSFNR
ncbi:MAG: FliM/FliN family flagellar motor switch protein [Planctomycetaceae bacterium]|jgi:flagellar motor switch/type III secretory pathway protein FliN|nr:FliM/FliN family flagellar motor switch protein [Planctomycetaceae bacterium]